MLEILYCYGVVNITTRYYLRSSHDSGQDRSPTGRNMGSLVRRIIALTQAVERVFIHSISFYLLNTVKVNVIREDLKKKYA